MKKISILIAVLIVLTVFVNLTGCGNNSTPTNTIINTPADKITSTPTTTRESTAHDYYMRERHVTAIKHEKNVTKAVAA